MCSNCLKNAAYQIMLQKLFSVLDNKFVYIMIKNYDILDCTGVLIIKQTGCKMWINHVKFNTLQFDQVEIYTPTTNSPKH